jgi:hypothetical protein
MPKLSGCVLAFALFFLVRFLMGFREVQIAKKRRCRTGVLRPTAAIYQGQAMWLGGTVGALLAFLLRDSFLFYVLLAVTVALMLLGRKYGRVYGLKQDELLAETWEEIREEEMANYKPDALDEDENESENTPQELPERSEIQEKEDENHGEN